MVCATVRRLFDLAVAAFSDAILADVTLVESGFAQRALILTRSVEPFVLNHQ
jgi:hypothetical protein